MKQHNFSDDPVEASRTPLGAVGARETTLFKIPIGRLGLLASLLMGGASGFIAFLLTFFFAILGMVIYDSATGKSMLNLDISYRYIAAPVGILVLIISLSYLVTVWMRRKLAGRG